MPKKQKKVGGAKGGGKTEEEKLVYLQQRAQAEEEMAKKKEELLALFLKDKLQKEQKNTALNLLKLNDGWRTILRQTRATELRKELSVLSQTFERQLDNLDSVIKRLECNLQEAERQSAQVWRAHLQHLERLWALQQKRLMFLQQLWEICLQELSSRFSCEREPVLAQCQQQRADLHNATFIVEQQHDATMAEIHRLYRENIALYESTNKEKLSLALEEEVRLREMTLKYQEAQQLFNKETKLLDDLVTMKEDHRQMEETSVMKIKKLQDCISQLKAKLNSINTKDKMVEEDMGGAMNELMKNNHKLRDQLTQAEAVARKHLTDLTVQSAAASKNLQKVIDKALRLLRVAEMCRKLESEQENIFTSSAAAENLRQERSVSEEEEELDKVVLEFPELRQVMLRINTALLHREALRKRKANLSRENQELRILLRQHLEAMTVSDGALNGPHALLTVYQAPTAVAPPDTTRRHTVIEAVHAVKHSL